MLRATGAVLAISLLFGCASVNPKPAFVEVEKKASQRTGQRAQWARTAAEAEEIEQSVRALLSEELTPDRAVQVAWLNNRSLQATFEEIGASQAGLVQSGLLSNPVLDLEAIPVSGGITELNLTKDLLDVLMQPLRKKIGAAQLEQTKLRVGDEMLRLAAEAKTAYYTLVARQQLVGRLDLIREINRTAAEFAQRQHDAGNINDLDLANQHALYNQSKVDVAVAQAETRRDRERLNRLMGLWGPLTDWRVTSRLPEMPEQDVPLEHLESLAISERLDVEAGRWAVDLVGRALALKKGTRYFPVGINVGVEIEREGGARSTGPSLALQLPIFDTGQASIARLEAQYRQSQRQLESLAVNARSEVREARDLMIAAKDLKDYYGEVLLPQRVQILDLTVRHYNMMLKGAYDVLLAKQSEVATERAYVEAWRDYWITRTELERAVGGKLPGTEAAAVPKPETKGTDNPDDGGVKR